MGCENDVVEVGRGRLARSRGLRWWEEGVGGRALEHVTVAWLIANEVMGRWTGWTDYELLRYAGDDVAR